MGRDGNQRTTGLIVVVVCLLTAVALPAGVADASPATVAGSAESPATAAGSAESPATVAGSAEAPPGEHVHMCAAEPPDDHADPDGDTSEVVGWVDGYWYDEPLEIDDSELTEDELEELVLRTAARVEAIRCLTFEELPPVEVLTREEYRESVEPDFENVSDEEWQFEDARLATMLVAGQGEDAEQLHFEVQTAFPAAFYDTEEEYIGFITDDPDRIEVDQVTLAHELTHALQDQHFDLERIFDKQTNDEFVAALAVAEGDATVVDEKYEDNCNRETWADECIVQPVGDADEPPSWPLVLDLLAAYHTPLVAERADDGDWDDVDALYEQFPSSTAETIYPERYSEFERAQVTVDDESDADWERIEIEDDDGEREAFDIVGQHGLTAILVAPAYETDGVRTVADPNEFTQAHIGGDLDYSITETTGWQGDRLHGYTNDDGEEAGVWKLDWEDDGEAETFAAAYADLIEYRGGEPAEGYENVYTFEEVDGWEMAVAIEQRGDRVLVVTAPTPDDLTAVHAAVELEATETPTPEEPTPGESTSTPTLGEPTPTDETVVGFGVALAVFALVGTTLLVSRRRS